ncbi:MAG: Dyp-type peroxidase [Chloroflexota bacterium]|nr:Dyp-type peroxidase [Chloroflexota bacterium]
MPSENKKTDKIRKHQHTAILCFNIVSGTTPRQLLEGFEKLAERIRVLKQGLPEQEQEPWLIKGNAFQLTATWAYGSSLFEKPELPLAELRPHGLRRMPDFPMEQRDQDFSRSQGDADLLVQFSCRHFFPLFRAINSVTKPGRLPFTLVGYHRGFQRADDRGMLRFFDGTSNLSQEERERLVPINAANQGELPWCDGGTFMVFRKLREEVRDWEALSQTEQEARIGRRKVDGFPLGSPENLPTNHPTFREPEFQGQNNQVPLDSHVRKMNPRQGVSPDTKIFRRGWPYFDGFASDGRMLAGLLFISFQRDLGSFEIIRRNWMTQGFPNGRTRADGILRTNVIHLVTGGYYFVPRAPRRGEAFPGANALRPALNQ